MQQTITCPSCQCTRYAVLRSFSLVELGLLWQQKVGFNPFSTTGQSGSLKKLLCMDCSLIYYTPNIVGDHTLYAKLSAFGWYYPKNKWEFDFSIRLLKQYQSKRVLEVGCGAGEFLHRLKHCAKRVVGIDINEQALAIAKKRGLSVSNESASTLNESFDMIFMFQVLEHLEFPNDFIGELVDKIEPEGYLVLAVPNPDGYMKEVERVFLDMPPHHATCWSKEALQHLAARHGLKEMCYATEPINIEYLRVQLFAQIDQSSTWRVIKFVQKIVVLAFLPLLYMMRNPSIDLGQTHLMVLKKQAGNQHD